MNSLAKKNFIYELKRIDWDFTGKNGIKGFAAYHWYPARFVPQIPGILINYLCKPGGVVLDPFCGSGTTLVEAFKFGRRAVGIDLNPTAVLMTKAKLKPFNERGFSSYIDLIKKEIEILLTKFEGPLLSSTKKKPLIPNYKENIFWYHKDTLLELSLIWAVLHNHKNSKYFIVGCAAFSAILKYCCSQEKHWGWVCDNVKPKHMVYKNAIKKFFKKLNTYKLSAKALYCEANELQDKKVLISDIKVYQGDCVEVLKNFSKNTFDLVITSPPYYNMTDYILSQRLSSLWFNFDMKTLRTKEIGSRHKRFRKNSLSEYLQRMKDSLWAIAHVLKKGHFCCLIIGESPHHQPFLDKLEKIYCEQRLKLIESLSRRVAKQRSLSPVLHHEKILILRKD